MLPFSVGDTVQIVNWNDLWDDTNYLVKSIDRDQNDRVYYNLTIVDRSINNKCHSGGFTAKYLRRVILADTSFPEVMVGGMSAEELKTVIDLATARLVELTKNS